MNITSNEFVSAVRGNVVDENSMIYEQLFTTTEVSEATNEYWKNALALFSQLNDEQRRVFFAVLRQVAVDSVSTIFAILDGSSRLDLPSNEIQLFVDGNRIDGELQDRFLEIEERNQGS